MFILIMQAIFADMGGHCVLVEELGWAGAAIKGSDEANEEDVEGMEILFYRGRDGI